MIFVKFVFEYTHYIDKNTHDEKKNQTKSIIIFFHAIYPNFLINMINYLNIWEKYFVCYEKYYCAIKAKHYTQHILNFRRNIENFSHFSIN